MPCATFSISCSLTYFETDGFDTPDSTAFDVIKYPLSFSISDSKISDVDIVFVIPFASLKAQTSYEKCCAPPLFDL